MKKLTSLLLLLTLCITLNGCYDSKEISRIAFVIAVGFDEGSYTFQIVKPSAFESEGSEDSPLLTETVYAANVYEAMNKLNSKVSEICDYSHIKIVVFSRNVLERGIENEVDAMLKSDEFHPNTKIAMCEGKASEYMKDISIPLDANPAEYYENISGYNSAGYSADTRLKDIQKNYSTHIPGCAMPVINSDRGMAVTSNFKLTGTSNAEETLIYNMLKRNGFEGNITLSDGVVVNFKKTYSNYNINIRKKPVEITIKIQLEGNVVWSEKNADISQLEKLAKEKTERDITNFLYRCSDSYKADILEFYKYAKTHYTTLKSWENENWQTLFENATYNVTADINIKREGSNIN